MSKFKFTLLACFVLLIAGCASRPAEERYYVYNTDSIENLKHIGHYTLNSDQEKFTEVRKQAIEETALSLGARAGLASRAKAINAELEQQKQHLESTFNFNALLLEHNVLPPVLAEGRGILRQADNTTLRLADRTYKILAQARFVTTPPNWRGYIWLNFKAPERPDSSLLPRNPAEKALWDQYIVEGWASGLRQADNIFADRLARMKQDFEGMVLYRKLLAQKIVSAPYVARTRLGVTGNSGELNIDDQVLRITALPQLQPDAKAWESVISISQKATADKPREKLSAQASKQSLTDKKASTYWEPVIEK